MHVDVVVIESDDVAMAVAEEVAKDATTKLVVGASSGGIFKRYLSIYSVTHKKIKPQFFRMLHVSSSKL